MRLTTLLTKYELHYGLVLYLGHVYDFDMLMLYVYTSVIPILVLSLTYMSVYISYPRNKPLPCNPRQMTHVFAIDVVAHYFEVALLNFYKFS